MTPLRHRMIQDLQLRGYATARWRLTSRPSRNWRSSIMHHRTFSRKSRPAITCCTLLHLTTVKKVARASHTIALCGIKFFYQRTLGRTWTVLDVARPNRAKKLPVVLGRDEVWRILDHVRIPVCRVCLTTIYACDLRLMEGARLRAP